MQVKYFVRYHDRKDYPRRKWGPYENLDKARDQVGRLLGLDRIGWRRLDYEDWVEPDLLESYFEEPPRRRKYGCGSYYIYGPQWISCSRCETARTFFIAVVPLSRRPKNRRNPKKKIVARCSKCGEVQRLAFGGLG